MENLKNPLQWPEGWPRIRIQDRADRIAWKKGFPDALLALEKELKRLGATHWTITVNDLKERERDPGVAVWFSLKAQDQLGWQEALGFIGEIPTIQQIDHAYAQRAKKLHPDGPTPDVVLFNELTKHRENARAWARGEEKFEHEKVIPCDAFKEARWNVTAIRLVIYALRMIERCGAPVMMDRAFRGFSKALIGTGTPGADVQQGG